jgi:ribosomal protein S18 acetylase RimI-like enzyme
MREKRGLPVRDMTLADLPTALALLHQALEDRELPYPTLDLPQFERDLVIGLALPEVKALVAVTKRESFKVKGLLIGRVLVRDLGTPKHLARIEVLAVDPIFRARTPSVAGRLVDQFWRWSQLALSARGETQAVLEIAHSPGGYQAEAVAQLGAVAYEVLSVVATETTAVVRPEHDAAGAVDAHPRLRLA